MLLSSDGASDDPRDAEHERLLTLNFFSSPIAVRLFSLLPLIFPVHEIAPDASSVCGFIMLWCYLGCLTIAAVM